MTPHADHGEHSYRGTGRLVGRKALIAGADSGIGAAVASAFAREGADVAFAYLPEEEGDARVIAQVIEREGKTSIMLPVGIQDADNCRALVKVAVETLGGLDILVNNAGMQQYCGNLEDLSDEKFDATLKTNVYAMFWITKEALPHLRNQDRASSTRHPSRPIFRRPSLSTMQRRKQQSTNFRKRWRNS